MYPESSAGRSGARTEDAVVLLPTSEGFLETGVGVETPLISSSAQCSDASHSGSLDSFVGFSPCPGSSLACLSQPKVQSLDCLSRWYAPELESRTHFLLQRDAQKFLLMLYPLDCLGS